MSDYSVEQLEHMINSGQIPELSQPASPKQQVAVEPTPTEKLEITPIQVPAAETKSEITYTQGRKYAGDFAEDEERPNEGWAAFEFPTPAHVLAMFNDSIMTGEVTMHQWQKDVNLDLAPAVKPTSKNPLKYFLVAANGSGKDAFVIAPFAIWFVLSKIRSQVIITSASGTQLTAQTESYIRSLAERVNQKLGTPIFKIRQRYIRCLKSGSVIRMFATDEAGKAEGYHPLEPNAEMAIIKNESKSIPEDIHKALKRCTGYNYWLEISSPGAPIGAFHYAATNWKTGRSVTSYDCPHISEQEREEDKRELGEDSPEYRSKHLALFTYLDTETVIPATIVDLLIAEPPIFDFLSWPLRIGIDIAAGGDETVITACRGVKIVSEEFLVEKDTTVTARWLNERLTRMGISKTHDYIFADDGGIGHAVIDMLTGEQYGWTIHRVLNQSAAYNRKRFGNRGAELYFNVRRIFEEKCFNLKGISRKCREQLVSRKFKQQQGGRVFLQPKKEAKAEGQHSPDRADAFCLTFSGLTIEDFLGETRVKKDDEPKRKVLKTSQEVQDFYDGITFKEYEMIQGNTGGKHKAKGSLQVALGVGKTNNKEDTYGIYSDN